ncbi:methyl-accepting chemotaxis protein [Geomonas sp. Red32]|uniref:methyl-accepting chemotaxis protein n=1 Tax=Geomonas sp. Red32 TaxID=2912856 RepID=UPI00202CAB25|nr:methyl-accepting chemotaxis protein [Geomonas sp. Red32]MCM0082462.1 methyl-accepting chemotaxis protein [Geomonas sp. Red32]
MKLNSIRAKLTAAIVVAMVATVVILGAVNYWITRGLLVDETQEGLRTLAIHNAEKLNLWLDIRKGEVAELAASPLIAGGNDQTRLEYLKNENRRNPVYAFLYVADADGNAILTTGAKTNVADRPYFKEAKSGKVVVSAPVRSKVDGKQVVVVAAPITRNGQFGGVVAATVGLDDLIKMAGKIKPGATGYAYVLQKDGLTIIHPSEKLVMKHNVLEDSKTGSDLKDIAGKMVAGESGIGTYSFKGVKKYCSYAPIAGPGWSLGVTVPVHEVTSKLNEVLLVTLAVLVVALAAAAVFSFLIAGTFTKPLLAINALMEELAGGDLTKRLAVSSRDELGETGRHLNSFVDRMQGSISQVAQTSSLLFHAATKVKSAAGGMADGADRASAQVGTVATAGEEMAATSCDIAHNCQLASEGAREANEVALAGARVVEETIAVMSNITHRVKGTAAAVGSLGARSDQIGAIVGTIEDIADQTNLLALNAAIEAARAGEQGRGFAVVADEVRALAERTTRATREIGEMIKAIQKETGDAVTAMEEGVTEVARGTEKAAGSGRALEEILEKIAAVTSQVQMVAVAAEEQTATTSEISANMQRITEIIGDTTSGARDSAAAAVELHGSADELQRLVRQFKIG